MNRDFRITTFGAQWTSSVLTDQGNGEYVAQILAPEAGATALMVELSYNVGGHSIVFTSDISVVEHQAADFDRDGDIDGADLSKWQEDFGHYADRDADGDDDTDGHDLLVWQRQFDSSVTDVASSATVPEPTSGAMLMAWMLTLLTRPMR